MSLANINRAPLSRGVLLGSGFGPLPCCVGRGVGQCSGWGEFG